MFGKWKTASIALPAGVYWSNSLFASLVWFGYFILTLSFLLGSEFDRMISRTEKKSAATGCVARAAPASIGPRQSIGGYVTTR